MSKRWAAAKYVACGGCHKSFRRLSAHINQSSVCYNYYCSTPNEPVSDSGIKSRLRCVPVLLLSRMPLSLLLEDNFACNKDLVTGSVTHFNASGPISCRRTYHKPRSSPTGLPPYTTAPPHAYVMADTALAYNVVAALS